MPDNLLEKKPYVLTCFFVSSNTFVLLIIEDIKSSKLMMMQPMDVRKYMKLDTKSAYDLFALDSFP